MDWGSRATRTSRPILKTSICFRHMAIGKTVFLRREKGVDDGCMIKTKQVVSLFSSSVKIKDGLTVLGMKGAFEVQTATGLVILFSSPDALSLTEIWYHKQ